MWTISKNASALEDATKPNVIVFDKTGTLIIGQPEVGGAGTDVAMESADVVPMKSDPYDIAAAIELSRARAEALVALT